MGAKEIRKGRGVSLIAAAVGAGVAEATVRLYEANRDAVTAEKRAALDRYYERLECDESNAPPRSDRPEPSHAA